jgi:hypothetical protein
MGYQPKTLKERKTPEVFKEKKALQIIGRGVEIFGQKRS